MSPGSRVLLQACFTWVNRLCDTWCCYALHAQVMGGMAGQGAFQLILG
jgi:hypothetical protein